MKRLRTCLTVLAGISALFLPAKIVSFKVKCVPQHTAVISENVRLYCKVLGLSAEYITYASWYKDRVLGEYDRDNIQQETPTHSSRFQFKKDLIRQGIISLNIKNVEQGDQGIYKCKVSSVSITREATVKITVQQTATYTVIVLLGYLLLIFLGICLLIYWNSSRPNEKQNDNTTEKNGAPQNILKAGGLEKVPSIFVENKKSFHLTGSFPQVGEILADTQRYPFVPEEQIKVYEDQVLGIGGSGTVYYGSYLGTPAAIKKIANKDFSVLVKREISICMGLSHPHIVKLMAVCSTDEAYLIASEYIEGASLDKVLHQNVDFQLTREEVHKIGLEIALAVQYIHSRNILHRDIKPANVMAKAQSKKALLTDWGMAEACDSLILSRGPDGGTYIYMAPECFIFSAPSTTYSDMWSFGITLLELFSKHFPWAITNYTELLNLMLLKNKPQAIKFLSSHEKHILLPCLNYNQDLRPSISDVVTKLKDLKKTSSKKHGGFR
ncbi:uncharacterized protein LOC114662282 [Erpetoichthys calabaricus]|uniref:uncharacterized protein LOC114662282 n=1 Tax=Erpetoichthys calabaricus TaxID=27687 RepID=UPI0022342D11|nr:uncharacterized protein LOC114662282 [Erpetoichthys calabaricus]